MSRLNYLLGAHYQQWHYDDSYLIYVTPEIVSNNVIANAVERFDGLIDKVIWDLFSGIGTDAIRFSRYAGLVICTEINKETFTHLEHNKETMQCYNIKSHHGSCLDYIDTISCDIAFFDPPWGDTFQSGTEFDFSKVMIDDVNVLDLAKKLQKKCHLIIKSPIYSNSFEQLFSPNDICAVYVYRQPKLKFIFVVGGAHD